MDGYTLKALLMIALFVLLEAALNFPRTQRLRQSLYREISQTWHWLAIPPHALQPVKIRPIGKRRRI